jgi:glycosyltransferase involved in cell wall biosynthesis
MSGSTSDLVSIVIPVFNGMPYLPEAVKSALDQEYRPLEVVVVDNASTDGSRQYLETLSDPLLRVVYREHTQAAAANWTEAISHARGSLVKLMCADDVLHPGAITRQVDTINAHPRAGLVANRRAVMNGAGETIKRQHGLDGLRGQVVGIEATKACLRAGTNLLGEPVCVLFRADVIKAAMPWEARWPYMTDMATYAKVLARCFVVCDPVPIATFRISSTSWSSDLLREQPNQFRGWRAVAVKDPAIGWSALDHLRSNISLALRTAARRAYFVREQRAERKR